MGAVFGHRLSSFESPAARSIATLNPVRPEGAPFQSGVNVRRPLARGIRKAPSQIPLTPERRSPRSAVRSSPFPPSLEKQRRTGQRVPNPRTSVRNACSWGCSGGVAISDNWIIRSMHPSFLKDLVCPRDKSTPSRQEHQRRGGGYWQHGTLISTAGTEYPIRDFIPRFSDEDYCANFTVEWAKHPHILHEAQSNLSMYRARFAAETKWEEDLSGQLVLEAACGPGALTQYPLERGATVISFDLSDSVTKARELIGPSERSLFVQTSIFDMPFNSEAFDKCFCFGVTQTTPDPKRCVASLVKMLKPGGWLSADSYVPPAPKLGGGHRLIRAKYRFRKLQLWRLPPRVLHFVLSRYVDILCPSIGAGGRTQRASNA
jgi:SAM-dependent methyltransferase